MKNKKVAAAVAIVLILICFVPASLVFNRPKKLQCEIVCFGDSVMAGFYDNATIPGYIETYSGRKTLNAAFGGLTMSAYFDNPKAGDASHLFSMVELSDALVKRDFSLQTMATKRSIGDYPQDWYGVTEALNAVDWDSVKYVFIEQGVNDYLLGKPTDDASDRYNRSTFAGALRTSIENVQKALPDAEIVLLTPIYNWAGGADQDCTERDLGGGTLLAYIDKEKEVAAEYGLICVDNFHGSGINRDNYKEYLYDGLHTLEEANALIAQNIINNVEGLRK
ncbi:MAG: SGNH/GDSL hydrolase family protein [Lachnospiraceae bacterium]|nr:SGNH/GDSL hydrolase family protein [Lachnospiraceae bacterium]MBR5994371.1 SGNH/GDSL hydrolase family protein [Lachnospiraceae bacterium]